MQKDQTSAKAAILKDEIPAIPGVLLAGGLARRMGGGDKPMRQIGGRAILARAIARLAPQCDGLVLNANGDPARFAAFGLPVVPDSIEGFPGPLAGVLAGLDWMAAHRPEAKWLLSAAADCPFLPRDLVARLSAAQAASGAPIAVAASGGQSHHVVALWSVALREELRAGLASGEARGVGRWIAGHGPATAEWATKPFDPFFNANTTDDLAEAEQIATLDNGG